MKFGGFCLLALVALAACTQPPPPRQSLFVVLPNADGSAGAITVDDGKNSVVLDRAYAASEVRGGTAAPVASGEAEVGRVFGAALAARPVLPAQFRLYFVLASDQLTPESETAYRAVFEDLKRRAAYEVEVVGHTDTVGVKANNHTLSLQRANAVRDRLVRDGLKGESIATAGRGEVDLAVPTADNVAEPRNRRVEITIR